MPSLKVERSFVESADGGRRARARLLTPILAIATVSILVGTASPVGATEPDLTQTASDTVIVDGPEISADPGETTSRRKEPKAGPDGSITPNAVTIGTCYANPISNRGRTYRASAYIEVGFTSTVTWSGFGCYTGTFNGSSYGKWTGTGYASKITLRDEFSYAGAGAVSISASPGASIVGGVIKWSGSASSTKQVTHKFTGYSFSGLLFTVTESASMTAQFGSAFYTANA